MYYVYVLLCKDGSLYTGSTNDIPKRFETHQKGLGGKYTHSHPPIKIVYEEELPDKSIALKREAEIKKWPRAKKITNLNLILEADD